jgi:hypothetical protein
MDGKQARKKGRCRVDRGMMNEKAWSIVDRADGKRRKKQKRKLTERQRTREALERRVSKEKRRRLVGSEGAAGPCVRIDPKTGEAVGIVKKSRRANSADGALAAEGDDVRPKV